MGARQRLDGHGDVESAIGISPVAAVTAEERRSAERGHGLEPDFRFNPFAPTEPGPGNRQPLPGKLPLKDGRDLLPAALR